VGDLFPTTYGVSSVQFLLWPDDSYLKSRKHLPIKRVLKDLLGPTEELNKIYRPSYDRRVHEENLQNKLFYSCENFGLVHMY
jgi:hypothetical protein